MNWFFNVVFLATTWSAVFLEEVTSSESLSFPKLEVIESLFKRSFENASPRELFDGGKMPVTGVDKEKALDILSYRQHGFHPGNAACLKMQCVWNAMNDVTRQLPLVLSSNNETRALIEEMCHSHAYDSCGVDFKELNCDPKQEYRTINGSCNNLVNTRWGAADEPFERFVDSDYGDGRSTFRLSEKGTELPNPRKISQALSNSRQGPQPEVTLMLMQWGQFIDHDITLTPERELNREKYTGPQDNIWDDLQCNITGKFKDKSLDECKVLCNDTLGCTAINYKEYKEGSYSHCVLRACDYPIPKPRWNFPPYKGYSLNKDPVEESATMECCNEGLFNNSVCLEDACVPIDVEGDPFYVQDGRQCIRFVRSMPAPSRRCEYAPMEQINRNTAIVDGSMVYGSDEDVAAFVRTGKKGLLATTEHEGNDQPLPPRGGDGFPSAGGKTMQCPQAESMDECYIAGDVRVDEIPGLTALHTTFIRLHNVIAEDLCILNPKWCKKDDKIFQETRRIVIALIQQITYRDWLPQVVGPTLMEENQLELETQGYRDMYDESVNPTVRNVFATAAFRFGHSLIADVIKAAKQANNLKVPGNFFNIEVVQANATSPSSLLNGLTRCPSAPIDAIVEPAFTNSLFAEEPAENGLFFGLDLVSLNIQRGRDHGIPGYTEWRRFCGVKDPTTFRRLKNIMPNDLVKAFKGIYHNVDDIDLFPAGLSENSIADGILGPTFSCIIARQFALMKRGDRFWYEREDQPKPFTPDQLSSIRSQGLVSILCRVSEHTSFGFQPNPFLVATPAHKGNAVMNCSSYNFINLQPWKEFN